MILRSFFERSIIERQISENQIQKKEVTIEYFNSKSEASDYPYDQAK